MTFRLQPVGGMCNRLQAMVSYLATHGSLDVWWDDSVPHFLTVFDPLPGVTFVQGGGFVDYGIPVEAPTDWRNGYAALRPIAPILERVAAFQGTLGADYLALHVRRTDMTPLAARVGQALPSDADFWAWTDARPGPLCWLATDNGQTQDRYLDRDSRIRFAVKLHNPEHVRDHADHPPVGPLSDAVVDLWMCVGAADWMGSGAFGTFSNTIRILRDLKGETSR